MRAMTTCENGKVHISIDFKLDCSTDAAWDALHSPKVAAQLYSPLIRMVAVDDFPNRFESGDTVSVSMRLFGLIPVGSQTIKIEDKISSLATGSARTMVDAGKPTSGPLALLKGWHHEITISPSSSLDSRWHDELTITGALSPLFWPVLATMWLWRKHKLKRLSAQWE